MEPSPRRRRMRWDRFDQDMGCCGDLSCLIGSSLVLTILSCLDDLQALFRARCVCKSWYDAVLSPQFILLRDQRMATTAEEPWALVKARTEVPSSHIAIDFGVFDHKLHYDYYDYNNSMESHVELWRPLSSSSSRCSLPLGPPGSLFLGLGASSHGLVCGLLMEEKDCLSLAVGNPLTGEWERLPPAPVDRLIRPPYMVFLLQADPPPRHGGRSNYRVLAFEDRDDISLVVLYDSRNGAWECMPGFNLDGACADAPASMLLEADAFGISNYEPATIAALKIESMAWHYVHITAPMVDDDRFQGLVAPMVDDARFWGVRMFTHAGRCILVGIFISSDDEQPVVRLGFGVWELELGERWRLLSRMNAVDEFGEGCSMDDDSDVKVQACGDMIFFSAWYKRKTHGSWPPVAHHLPTSSWHCFKERTRVFCPDVDYECSYAFVPSLAAQP